MLAEERFGIILELLEKQQTVSISQLCEKLGIGITAESSEHGTAVSLSFHINCLIHEVQN